MANEFLSGAIAGFKRIAGAISRNLQKVDGSKGMAIVLAVFMRCCHKNTF